METHDKELIIDAEHLRKLFVFPDSQDKFLDFGHEILDGLYKRFKEEGALHSSIYMEDLEDLFNDIDIPKSPKLLKTIFPEIQEKIFNHSVKVYSPYYIGHMTSAVPYFTILLELIIASLNQNQVKIETAKASSYVERELISWIHRLIYNKKASFYKENIQNSDVALGNVTIDGTLANMTAMLVARNKLFSADGDFPGIAQAGIADAYKHYKCKRAVILISQRGHYSFEKIGVSLGIGRDNIIKIPVDSNNKMDINHLEKEIKKIKKYNAKHKKKIFILSIVGIAGTTETGNIDDLSTLQRIAEREGVHYHVDAAWGGPVLFVKDYAHLFKGIEEANSVTFDSHKLLYLPLSMGMVLFKNQKDLNHLKHSSNYVVRKKSRDLGRFTIEGSRPFSALRPWVALKVIGSEGFRLLFESAFTLSKYFHKSVAEHENFEALNTPELFIFNYRFIPSNVQKKLRALLKSGENNKLLFKVNGLLNKLNKDLQRKIRSNNKSFVSRTLLESTVYKPQLIQVMRAVTINPLTTPEIIDEIIIEHNKLGINLYKKEYEEIIEKMLF